MILEAAALISVVAVVAVATVVLRLIALPFILIFKPEVLKKYHPDYKEGLN